jgi:hypothetical protein
MAFPDKLRVLADGLHSDESSWEIPALEDPTPSIISPERRERLENYLAKGGLRQDLLDSRRSSEIKRDEHD